MLKKIVGEDNALKINDIKYLPRWLVLMIDVGILFLTLIISLLVLKQISPTFYTLFSIPKSLFLGFVIHIFYFFVFKTYSGTIRHTASVDILKIFLSIGASLVSIFILSKLYSLIFNQKLFLTSGYLVFSIISFIGMVVFRLLIKQFFQYFKAYISSEQKQSIFIYGIESPQIAIAEYLINENNPSFKVEGFIVNADKSSKVKILGKPVLNFNQSIEEIQKIYEVKNLLVDTKSMDNETLNIITKDLIKKGVNLYKLSETIVDTELDNGAERRSKVQIKSIQIDDLLNRKTIKIENEKVNEYLFDKTVLVTGGAGSIGSEIVRQLLNVNPKKIVIFDQAETPLNDLYLSLIKKNKSVELCFELGDVSNRFRVEQIFKKYRPDVVYHAAAYKHVPIIEENPQEAVIVNMLGTKNLAKLAKLYQVDRFVLISTDKAVNPTNVMGATKRAAEIYVQSLQFHKEQTTKFITTRFGNVLGSNGSVIPLFKRQIEEGGPITVTHPEIERYFMTIPEACLLVLQAGVMGKGGEIFVFDMGNPVKIYELAKNMIRLSGFEPHRDIKIIYTGLRPGEKLYEELLTVAAKTLPTYHEKILISKEIPYAYKEIKASFNKAIRQALSEQPEVFVSTLKEIIPEYKSNNSIFESLDHR